VGFSSARFKIFSDKIQIADAYLIEIILKMKGF
jgi:hypothetical protein